MSSQKNNSDWLLALYQSKRAVFGLSDIALITGELNPISLAKKVHYQIGKGNLLSPRKGLYTKPNYDFAALAGCMYTPSYLSLEYVLQKEGIIFQYDHAITAVSYLSRNLMINNRAIKYRKIKESILLNTAGIVSTSNEVNMATKERALLDLLYLNGATYFDNLKSIDKKLVADILPIYESKKLVQLVENTLLEA
jgi:hypothetical protein